MGINRFIVIIVLFCFFFGANAKKKENDYPLSEIKVEYTYHYKFLRGSDGVVELDVPFILLANNNQSKFYCPNTEYKDSLLSTPSGRAKERELFNAAATAYMETRNPNAMDAVVYHTRIYVTKDFIHSASTTYDKAGMGE